MSKVTEDPVRHRRHLRRLRNIRKRLHPVATIGTDQGPGFLQALEIYAHDARPTLSERSTQRLADAASGTSHDNYPSLMGLQSVVQSTVRAPSRRESGQGPRASTDAPIRNMVQGQPSRESELARVALRAAFGSHRPALPT